MTGRGRVLLLLSGAVLAMGMDCDPVPRPSCVFDLTLSSDSVAIGGTSGDAAVYASPGTDACGWTISSDSSWLTVSGDASGVGEGRFSYTAAPNSGPARAATMSLRVRSDESPRLTRTVNQAGVAAALSFAVGSVSVGAGAQANQTVQLDANVPWTISSNQPWLRVTSGASGSGSASITYAVDANQGTASRVGTLTVVGGGLTATLTVSQAGEAPPVCAISVNPSSRNVSSGGEPGTIAVTANCAWTSASDQSWLRITGGGSASGNGTLSYTVDPNTGGARGPARITVSGAGTSATFIVNQEGVAPPSCSISANPSSRNVPPGGESGTVAVTATCAWTSTSDQSWLRVTSGGSGSANGILSYTVDANTEPLRTGTITMSGGSANATFQVTQQAGVGPFLTLNPTVSAPPVGGQAGLTTAVSSNVNWTASVSAASASWLSITAGASGSGNGQITYSADANDANPGTARTGQINVSGPGVSTATLTVNQAGCAVAVNPTSQPVPASGGNFSVGITTTCAWSASISASATWLTFSGASSGTGNATLNYSAQANPGAAARPASITVTVPGAIATVTVDQAGLPALSVDFTLSRSSGGPVLPPGVAFTKDGSGSTLYDLSATVSPQAPGVTYQWLQTSGGGLISPLNTNPTTWNLNCATQPNSQFTLTIRVTVSAPGFVSSLREYSWPVFVNQCGT